MSIKDFRTRHVLNEDHNCEAGILGFFCDFLRVCFECNY